jgi:hypothetical protein
MNKKRRGFVYDNTNRNKGRYCKPFKVRPGGKRGPSQKEHYFSYRIINHLHEAIRNRIKPERY